MEPITREEYYLAKIAGTYEGNTPEPVTIEDSPDAHYSNTKRTAWNPGIIRRKLHRCRRAAVGVR